MAGEEPGGLSQGGSRSQRLPSPGALLGFAL